MPIARSQRPSLHGQRAAGGVDHAAVDPQTGDVVYVYGNRDPTTGNNRLAMRRLTDDGAGGLVIGPEIFISGQVQAAIPAVAVTDEGTIGVFYYRATDHSQRLPDFHRAFRGEHRPRGDFCRRRA